jgi:hypothetical protein
VLQSAWAVAAGVDDQRILILGNCEGVNREAGVELLTLACWSREIRMRYEKPRSLVVGQQS